MKKTPLKIYEKQTCSYGMTAVMTCESKQRRVVWLQQGCNAFNNIHPISNPMSFWTEQDVLAYIRDNKLPICSLYGDIVEDKKGKLSTTGMKRTGCMFCGFGSHIKNDDRFVRMKETHPKQYEYIMRSKEQGGLGYKEIIDWINENGKFNIKY